MECPKCGSQNVTPSHKRGVERVMRYVYPRAPYRCKECWSRFWKFQNPFDTTGSRIAGGLILLALILLIVLLFWPFGEKERPSDPGRAAPVTSVVDQGLDGERRPVPMSVEKPATAALTDAQPDASTDASTDPAGTQTADAESTGPEPGAAPAEAVDGAAGTGAAANPSGMESQAEKPVVIASAEALSGRAGTGDAGQADPAVETGASDGRTAAAEKGDAPAAAKKPAQSADVAPDVAPDVTMEAGRGAAPAPDQKARARSAAASGRGGSMIDIQQLNYQGGFQMAVNTSRPIEGHKAFYMNSPPRLVINVKGDWRIKGASTYVMKNDLVERVRAGEHSGYLSLVLDLSRKESVFPKIRKTDRGFILTLNY